MIDAVRHHEYNLLDAVYHSSSIYVYKIENAHAIPLVYTNRITVIISDNLTFN
jgi:hypothetical protein